MGANTTKIVSRRIYIKIYFIFQGREMLLFLTANMAALTSPANKQLPVTRHFSQCDLTLAKKLLANDKIFGSLSQKKINVTNSKHEL